MKVTSAILVTTFATVLFAEQIPRTNFQQTPPATVETSKIAETPKNIRRVSRSTTSVERADLEINDQSWWRPSAQVYELGYEAGGPLTASGAITAGYWLDDSLGLEFYLAVSLPAGSSTATVSSTSNLLATPNTLAVQTTYSGSKAAPEIALAINPKIRFVQTDWFQLNVGIMAAVYIPTGSTYPTGTRTENYADAADTTNKTVSDAVGSVNVSNAMKIGIGPRISSQFYLKWFPHLAIGLSTGLFTFLMGDTTTTTTTTSKNYTVVNGVDQAPSTNSSVSSVASVAPGLRGAVFGVGGATFSLFGTFSLRYVW